MMKTMKLARRVDPYPEKTTEVAAASLSRIDEFAAQAARQTIRYYGQIAHFDQLASAKPMRCEDWYKEHWRRFPAVSPDGGRIIEVPLAIDYDDPA